MGFKLPVSETVFGKMCNFLHLKIVIFEFGFLFLGSGFSAQHQYAPFFVTIKTSSFIGEGNGF